MERGELHGARSLAQRLRARRIGAQAEVDALGMETRLHLDGVVAHL